MRINSSPSSSEYGMITSQDEQNQSTEPLLHSDSFQGGEEERKLGDPSEIDSCFNTSLSSISHKAGALSDQFLEKTFKWRMVKCGDPGEEAGPNIPPSKKNHSTTLHNNKLYVFGGYDGKKNHNTISVYSIDTKKWSSLDLPNAPSGRNGHTATLIDNRRVFIIGGWLGSGPFAANDLHILDLVDKKWEKSRIKGEAPGPCNMHTADLIDRKIYVFRGGNGKDYLNDLHTLNVDSLVWSRVEAQGNNPPQRANHSSAVINHNLYIFGGWDGSKRLNDLFTLDTERMEWTEITTDPATTPSPRAGMSLTNLDNKLVLFGGSGHSALCYNDIHIYNPTTECWHQVNSPFLKQDNK